MQPKLSMGFDYVTERTGGIPSFSPAVAAPLHLLLLQVLGLHLHGSDAVRRLICDAEGIRKEQSLWMHATASQSSLFTFFRHLRPNLLWHFLKACFLSTSVLIIGCFPKFLPCVQQKAWPSPWYLTIGNLRRNEGAQQEATLKSQNDSTREEYKWKKK